MKIGSLNIELLSEGKFEIFNDGHINRSLGEANPAESAGSHSAITGINPVLVQQDENNILLDAGLGWGLDAGSNYTGVSNVRTNLAIFGLSPEDITHVILSHLHYDHAAGCSFTDRDSVTRATFPMPLIIFTKRNGPMHFPRLPAVLLYPAQGISWTNFTG